MTEVRVVSSEDPRDFQRRDWNDLVLADPAGTIFHTPEFLKLYWEEFGEEPSTCSCCSARIHRAPRSPRSPSS